MVNAQPSTAISCVAAKKFKQKNINVRNVRFGFSVNTSQSLMFIPKNNRKKPETMFFYSKKNVIFNQTFIYSLIKCIHEIIV